MQPLAERMRPKTLDEFTGQEHLISPGSVLHSAIASSNIPSMILWGPPGSGKTTIAHIISNTLKRPFYELSAVSAGVKEVRNTVERAKGDRFFDQPGPILFIDEIHRFNKAQQDSLLNPVERGIVTLIGATTENPSFEVNSALLSRCQVYILKPLGQDNLKFLANRAIEEEQKRTGKTIVIEGWDSLMQLSGGDARKLYNIIELALLQGEEDKIILTDELAMDLAQQYIAQYDKGGELHYDIISAFIKSVRGSDPNAAIYYMARMLQGGEDIKFICRRMVILAAEDIGLANPNALLLANACFDAVHKIGMPEARIIMSETVIYLANSPKSNSAYLAIKKAEKFVRQNDAHPVPLHLRNAVTSLMKNEGYGKDYQYAHDFEDNFIPLEYLPEEIEGTSFYNPSENRSEAEMRKRLRDRWKEKYGY